ADDRLRRAARQEDGEPASLRSRALARFGKARVLSSAGTLISSSRHFSKEKPMGSISKEEPMGSKRASRRELLKGGAALAGGLTLGAVAPALGQTPASGEAPAHDHAVASGSRNA